jgi:hypothetical protein
MIMISEATYGEKTYIVSVGTGTMHLSQYKVGAYNEGEAVDKVANHLEEQGHKGLYYDHLELETMAKCSEYKTAEAFAEANNLTCCGNHGIYLEITSVKGGE